MLRPVMKQLAQSPSITFIGFVIVAFLMLVTIVLGIVQMSRVTNTMQKMLDIYHEKTQQAFTMRDAIRVRALKILNITMQKDPFVRDDELQQFYREAGRFREAREKLLSLGFDETEKEIDQRLVEKIKNAEPVANELAEVINTSTNTAANADIYYRVSAVQNAVLDVLDELVELQRARANHAAEETKQEYWMTTTINGVAGAFALVLSLIIGRVVTNYVERANRQLTEKNAALEEATKTKSQFLATISHEIRTPLNGVVGMTSLLRETALSDQQKMYVDTIGNSGDNLLLLINDLLDFSKMEAGKLELDFRSFNLVSLVDQTLELQASRAHGKNLDLAARYAPDIAHEYMGDARRLQQILMNLVSNAIKFTEKGSVVVSVAIEQSNGNGQSLRFEVQDTGIGISRNDQTKLFQIFTQVDVGADRKYGGSGLGLAISKQLVGMMGGQVGVESELGKGAKFWFTVNLNVTDNAKEAALFPEQSHPCALIVDPCDACADALNEMLTIWGLDAKRAHSANTALEIVARSRQERKLVDIAFIDVEIKTEDGESLIDSIQRQPGLKNIECIGIASTAYRNNDNIDDVPRLLRKPLSRHQVRARLFESLNLHPTLPKASEQYAWQTAIQSRTRSVLVAEDNPVNQMVVKGMLQKFNVNVDVVPDGQSAIDAVMKKQYDLIFMDCQMPILDGYEAAMQLRAMIDSGKIAPIPIVALTANALAGDREKCMAAGMNDFIAKPVKIEQLAKILECWVKVA